MNGYEATKMVLSRIQSLDPENAAKIMGYLLIQDQPEEEMIRLAFGPETHLLSFIDKAKSGLGLSFTTSSSAPSTSSSPSPFNTISNSIRPKPFPQSSQVIIPANNGFHMNPSSPSSPWSSSTFSDHLRSPRPASSLSYAAVVNGTNGNGSSSGSTSSLSVPFYCNSNSCSDLNSDEYSNLQPQEQFPFLDESMWKNVDLVDAIASPSGRSDSILFPYGSSDNSSWIDSGNCEETEQHHIHRSCSVSDAFLGGEDVGGGIGWRPCMYFVRGFCKNGNSCKFPHGGFADSTDGLGAIVGSPGKIDGFDELLRMNAIHDQRFAAATQLMASGTHQLPFNKCTNFFNSSQRFGCVRSEMNGFGAMGLGGNANSSSRQIYLTFPADSTFKEEDVSCYFSKFGPVQDVRIPYQQKRMFGFVTFVFPETVKLILAKGNPHFVCDSRVLVKPYKEKGKVADKKQHQHQMDRDFPACFSPAGLDSREPFDLPFGGRMLYNTHDMMLRRKLEEHAELQQAIELQGRRLMNMRLMNIKNHGHNNQFQHNLSPGAPIPSPTQTPINQNLLFPSATSEEVPEEKKASKDDTDSPAVVVDQRNEASNGNNPINCEEDGTTNLAGPDIHESLDHILPDNLFASPTKTTAEEKTFFFTAPMGPDVPPITKPSSNNVQVPPTTTLNVALKSCYLQMPRFCSGPETIDM